MHFEFGQGLCFIGHLVPTEDPGYPAVMAHTSTLNDNCATTIPKAVRDALGMQPGDALQWSVLRDGTLLCKHRPADPQRAAVALVSTKLTGQ